MSQFNENDVNNNPYYTELNIEKFDSTEIEEIIHNPNIQWITYRNFKTKPIPLEIMLKDKFYQWLYDRHPYKAGVLKMEEKNIYNWHKDVERGVCINYLINTPNISYTFFRSNSCVAHTVTELKYLPGCRYIFNNQEDHMVLNYDGTRMLLTIEFDEDKSKLIYDDLLMEITTHYTIKR